MRTIPLGRRIAALLCSAAALVASAHSSRAAITATPGLTGIRIWEFSGGANLHAYTPFAPQLLNQLPTLNTTTNDFLGNPVEPYDVFYSDAAGNVNPLGNWVTVEARYPAQAPFGGGLNLGAVDLVMGSSIMRANILGSWVGLGNNYLAGSEALAVDPIDTPVVPTTATTMGNTAGSNTARMRVTVGWTKFNVPEPTGAALVAGGTAALAFTTRRRAKGRPA